MAVKMIQCPRCGREISKKTRNCPFCGKKIPHPLYKQLWFYIAIAALALVLWATIAGYNHRERGDVLDYNMDGSQVSIDGGVHQNKPSSVEN